MMMMRLLSLAFVCLLRYGSAVQMEREDASSAMSLSSLEVLEQQQQQQNENQRRLTIAEYAIPPFAMSFRSPNILQGDVREDLNLLGSTIAGPLRDVVTGFVFQAFQILAVRNAKDPSIPQMIQSLTNVNFEVKVMHSERHKEEDHSLRHLQSSNWFEFYAEFVGAAYFIEPMDSSETPEKEFMEGLLGAWREQFMVEDYAVLRDLLRDSEEPILQNLDFLVILNDITPGMFPEYGDDNPSLGANIPNNNNNAENMTHGDKALISLMVVLGTATIVAFLFLARPYVVGRNSKFDPHQGAFPRVGDQAGVSLPGRGEDEMPVDPAALEESDRWLKEVRGHKCVIAGVLNASLFYICSPVFPCSTVPICSGPCKRPRLCG